MLCKDRKSNLRLLILFFVVLLERECIDMCEQRGNKLADAPTTTLCPFSDGYYPIIYIFVFSIVYIWVFSCLISKLKYKWRKCQYWQIVQIPGELIMLK